MDKEILYNKCLDYVEQRISNLQIAVDSVIESGKDETKSSAGDKHETGRAMAQLEQEKIAKQMQEALELKNTLLRINPIHRAATVSLGSLIQTSNGNFFISVAAGKIQVGSDICFAISPLSPIAKAFMGAAEKQKIDFNGQNYCIESIL